LAAVAVEVSTKLDESLQNYCRIIYGTDFKLKGFEVLEIDLVLCCIVLYWKNYLAQLGMRRQRLPLHWLRIDHQVLMEVIYCTGLQDLMEVLEGRKCEKASRLLEQRSDEKETLHLDSLYRD
jgi:hypothetical protein